jgi:hypothetical protein
VTFEALTRIALLAQATKKAHIGATATEQLANVPVMCATMDIARYRQLIHYWGSKLDPLAPMLALKDTSIDAPRDRLFPGRSLRPGPALQDSIVTLANSLPAHFRVLCAEVLAFLERNIRALLRDVGDSPIDSPVTRGLSLGLCALLALEHAQRQETELAQRGLGLVQRLVGWIPEEKRGETLLYDDVAELLWSVLLCCGALGAPLEDVAEKATFIREEIGDLHQNYYFTMFDQSFILGLAVVAGGDADVVAETRRDVSDLDLDYIGWDPMHGLGPAPGMNRNATVHYASSVDRVEEWARSTFPVFADDR